MTADREHVAPGTPDGKKYRLTESFYMCQRVDRRARWAKHPYWIDLSDRVDPVYNTHDGQLREHRPDVALDSQRSIWQRIAKALRLA